MASKSEDGKRAQTSQFWARWWRWLVAAVVLITVVVALVYTAYWIPWFGLGGYENSEGEWAREKTLWDFFDLCLVPFVLALLAAVFGLWQNWRQREVEKQRSETVWKIEEERVQADRDIQLDGSREKALQTYLDRMTELMEKGLSESESGDPKRSIARARTLTVLRQLDGERKGLLLRFLHESRLIGTLPAGATDPDTAIVDLSEADLGGANLRGANLRGAFLREADLREADLRDANLSVANLCDADLSEADLFFADLSEAGLIKANLREASLSFADLRRANLMGANLSEANLFYADLSEADLSEANLKGADLTDAIVTDEQLAEAKSLKGATMPDGTVHE